MPSFDVHQHLWPDRFLAALSERDRPPRLRDGMLETVEGVFPAALEAHDLDARLALLDRDGTDVAVISLAPTLGVDDLSDDERASLIEAYNDGAQEIVERSKGRFRAFSAGAVRDGFAGLCVSARAVADRVLDDRREPLFEELERRGLVLFVHPGPARPLTAGPPWWSAVVEYTAEMQAAYAAWIARGADAYPRLRVVFALLAGGAPFQLERLTSRGVETRSLVRPTVYLETSSYGRRALELCLATYGVRQLVFGSDVPVVDSTPSLQALGEFGDAVSDAIREENPSLLLG